jgi:hypothetical protein
LRLVQLIRLDARFLSAIAPMIGVVHQPVAASHNQHASIPHTSCKNALVAMGVPERIAAANRAKSWILEGEW